MASRSSERGLFRLTSKSLVVAFTLHAAPNTSYDVELFASPAGDPSGYGEGARYLGMTTVTTNGAGDGTGRASVGPLEAGLWITATATSRTPAGDTSEFSAAVRLVPRGTPERRGGYEVPVAVPAAIAPAAPTVALVAPARRRVYEL